MHAEPGSIQSLTSGAMAGVWERVREIIPDGVTIFDAHAHIGTDLDGMGMSAEGMILRQDTFGVGRSIVFPLNDPDAREDFSVPNDVVWRAYEEHGERLVPFFRLNPHTPYDAEFERCVQKGFMGIKLHPVSQKFPLDMPEVKRMLGMAAGVGLPVLIHTGHGMHRVVEPLLEVVEAHPELRLLLGHSAMVEVLEAARAFAAHENVLFETSVVRAKDLYMLFSSVEPSRICYGSDIPYGDLPSTLHATAIAARAAGLSDGELEGVFSGNIRRWFP